jgi:hypothetical protein
VRAANGCSYAPVADPRASFRVTTTVGVGCDVTIALFSLTAIARKTFIYKISVSISLVSTLPRKHDRHTDTAHEAGEELPRIEVEGGYFASCRLFQAMAVLPMILLCEALTRCLCLLFVAQATKVWITNGTLFFSPNPDNKKSVKGFPLAGTTLEKSDEKAQRTGLFFHTVSRHRFTIVSGNTKHVFACDKEEELGTWLSNIKGATAATATASSAPGTSSAATSAGSDAQIKALVEQMSALKMKNTQLKLKKAEKQTKKALDDADADKGSQIKLLLAQLALLDERNIQLKSANTTPEDNASPEQAAEVKALLAKLAAAKGKNAELRAGKSAAEIQDCLDNARKQKEAKIASLMAVLDSLRATNNKLKNPELAEDDAPAPPSDSMDSPRTKSKKQKMLRYSVTTTIKDVEHISSPVHSGTLKKRSIGVMKRWNKRYFEAGDGKLMCYTVRYVHVCMCACVCLERFFLEVSIALCRAFFFLIFSS